MQLDERVNTPISTSELERRWALTRASMQEHGVDVLLMQSNNDFMGGYPKWFTDIPATQGYADIVTFPVDDGMTFIGQGPFGKDRRIPIEGDGIFRGVTRHLTAAFYSSAHYCHVYDAELAARALKPYAKDTIGLIGTSTLSSYLVDHLRREMPEANFVDGSDLVDRIKAIKSPEEIEVIRGVAALQDAAMAAAFEAFRPGKRDRDITAAAEYTSLQMGSEQGLYMCASSPIGSPTFFRNRHFQNRVIQPGDQMAILIENSGAGGYYCEIGRTATLGPATDAMHREFEFALEARKFMLGMMKPGASCPEIWKRFNEFMDENDRPGEDRLNSHSMGYDLVERPLIRFDEPMPLAAGMVVSCHPGFSNADGFHWACDNYMISEHGTERLHAYPEKIVEIT
jgi:Xaa-Pro aminopeptidase